MMAEALFLRGTLDKLKIVPEFYHIAEYKTAGNMFTEKKFTPAHKEEVEGLLHSIYEQYLNDASKARGMDRAQFEALVNHGPFSSKDARDQESRRPPGLLGPGAGLFQERGNAAGTPFRWIATARS